MPNLVAAATPTTSPPPRHSRPSPLQPAPPRSRHHATLCGHASHPVAPALTRVAGTYRPCRPPTKMSFLSFPFFFSFIKLLQDNSYHIITTPTSLTCMQAAPSLLQPHRPHATTIATLTTGARPCHNCHHLNPAAYQPCHCYTPTSHTCTAATLQHLGPIPLVLIVVACTLYSYKYIIIL